MATAARVLNFSRDDEGGSRVQMERAAESEPAARDPYHLRPLPYEDIYLYIKRFDNAGVVRQADPAEGRTAWKAIAGSCVAAALLVATLLPSSYWLMAGMQIGHLKAARDQAEKELRTLVYEEARLLRIERLHEIAREREFSAPGRDQILYSQPKNAFAQNGGPVTVPETTSGTQR